MTEPYDPGFDEPIANVMPDAVYYVVFSVTTEEQDKIAPFNMDLACGCRGKAPCTTQVQFNAMLQITEHLSDSITEKCINGTVDADNFGVLFRLVHWKEKEQHALLLGPCAYDDLTTIEFVQQWLTEMNFKENTKKILLRSPGLTDIKIKQESGNGNLKNNDNEKTNYDCHEEISGKISRWFLGHSGPMR